MADPAPQPETLPTFLPRITIQDSLPTVLAELRDGLHAAEDIWLSVYLEDQPSVHGRVRLTESDGGGVELTPRDGVEVDMVSNTEFKVACPALKVPPTPLHFPLATPFSLRGGIDALDILAKGLFVVGGKDGNVRVGDVRGNRRTVDLKGHVGDIRAVAFFPSGEVVLTASSDMGLRVFSATDGSNPRTLTGHTKAVTALQIIGVGRTVASASLDGSVRFWTVATSTTLSTLRFTQPINAFVLGPTPSSLLLHSESESDPATSPPNPSTGLPPNHIALVAHTNGSASVVWLDQPAATRTIGTLVAGKSPLYALAYDPPKGLVAVGARDGTVSLFDLTGWGTGEAPPKDSRPIMAFRRATAAITSLQFSTRAGAATSLLVGTADGLPFRASLGLELGTGDVGVLEEYAGGDCESMVVREGPDGAVWIATAEGKLRRYAGAP